MKSKKTKPNKPTLHPRLTIAAVETLAFFQAQMRLFPLRKALRGSPGTILEDISKPPGCAVRAGGEGETVPASKGTRVPGLRPHRAGR